MKVRNVMSPRVVVLSPRTSYENAARILYGNRVSGAPVVDAAGEIVGIISEKDLFRAMFPHYEEYLRDPAAYRDQEAQEEVIDDLRREPIARFMSAPAVMVDIDAPILRAGGLLLAHGLHRLPVINHGALAGIVTREDIFQTILQRRLFSALQKVEAAPHGTITIGHP